MGSSNSTIVSCVSMLGTFLPPPVLLHQNTGNANQVNTNFITLACLTINNDMNNPDSSDYIEDIPSLISNWEFPEGTNY